MAILKKILAWLCNLFSKSDNAPSEEPDEHETNSVG